jgi:hypothetical protein
LIGDADARKRCKIVLSIVCAVDDLVVALREALEPCSSQNFQAREQRDLILNVAAMCKQFGCSIERENNPGSMD